MTTFHEGGCLCRAVRYRVQGVPLASLVCHCQSCRKSSPAASVGWLTFASEHFEHLEGALQAFESSPGVVRSFCPKCGSPLLYSHREEPGTLDVTTVSLDDAQAFPPTREVWLQHRLSWGATAAGLVRYPRGTDDRPCEPPTP